MPFPNINPAFETFLEPTRILLFGKKFPTLEYNPDPMAGVGQGVAADQEEFEPYLTPDAPQQQPQAQNPQEQPSLPMPPDLVEQALRQPDGVFARIYGFSYEGHYYKLPRPLLFLVRGEGDRSRSPEGRVNGDVDTFYTRFTGIEGKDWQFGEDILVWAVDKHEIAICLDVEISSFDQILLQPLVGRQEEGSFGSGVGSRNAAFFRTRGWGAHQDR